MCIFSFCLCNQETHDMSQGPRVEFSVIHLLMKTSNFLSSLCPFLLYLFDHSPFQLDLGLILVCAVYKMIGFHFILYCLTLQPKRGDRFVLNKDFIPSNNFYPQQSSIIHHYNQSPHRGIPYTVASSTVWDAFVSIFV